MRGKPWKTTTAWVFLSVILCSSMGLWIGFRAGLIERVYVYRDAQSSHQLSSDSSVRSVSWSQPVEVRLPSLLGPAPAPVPGSETATPAELSSALLTSVKNAEGNFDVHLLVYSPTGWSAPRPLAGAINSAHDEITPLLAPGGEAIYFASNRPGGLGGFDLYLSRRGANGWGVPIGLGSRVNSPYDESGPALHPSGALLVLSTNRPRSFLLSPPEEWSDVLLAGWKATDEELAYSLLAGTPARPRWSNVRPLEALSSPEREREACFSPAGDLLYFSSARRGGLGGFDLYRSHCYLGGLAAGVTSEDAHSPLVEAPENLGRPLNTLHDDRAPKLFHAGFAMLYRVSPAGEEAGTFLESRTREVFSEIEFASIPLRLLGRNLVRIGVLLLAGAILIVLTLALLRYRRFWTLNLILRCVSVALLLHAAMLYSFYFWRVSGDIVALAEKATETEITVEKTLTAKLSLEARRLDIQVPDSAHPALESVSRDERLAPPTVRSNEELLETQVLAVTENAGSIQHETAFEMNLHPSLTQPAQDLEAPRMQATPRATRVHLPAPEEPPAREAEEQLHLKPEAGVAASWKVETTTPRPGPVSAFEEKAGSPDSLPIETLVQEAATQVHAPVPEDALLPPVARSAEDPPRSVAALPVPPQAQATSPEGPTTADPATPRSCPVRNFNPSPQKASPIVRPAAIVTEQAPWTSPRRDLLPTAQSVTGALELPEAPLQPVEQRRPIARATAKLPEAAPPVPRDSSEEMAGAAPSMHASEKVAASSALDGKTKSDLRTAVARVETAPLVARTDSIIPVRAASRDRLAPRPEPGARLPSRVQSHAQAVPGSVTLPEGESGATPAEGAPEVADILTPKQPPRGLRRSAPGASRRAFADKHHEPLSPLVIRPESSTKQVEPSALLHPQPLLQPGPSRIPQPTARTIGPESAAPVALKLPEATPELKYDTSLKKVRSPAMRKLLVERMGGSDASEDAVGRGLQWLARHQSPAGDWDVDSFDAKCQGCRGGTSQVTCASCNAAVTALAILCFLGQNHTPENKWSPFREHVAKAIAWLLSIASADGSLAGEDKRYTMYSHGIATLALSEAYILTGNEELREPLGRAVQLIVSSQNTKTGGWRYKPRPPLRGDTSITGWQVLALTSARGAGLEVPEKTLERARHWLDNEVASGQHGGIYGYTSANEPRVAMVAEGMYARLLLGAKPGDRNIEEAARYVHSVTRSGGHLDNLYLLYYGNLALYYYQGWIWERWNDEVRTFLVRSQNRAGRLAGSWDPTGPWSESGGRVLSTCLATLTLEVYYRYLPLYRVMDTQSGPTK